MKVFNADLHIHTVLSPCGSLEMSPGNIVKEALKRKLDIIGITDHNSTRQCRIVAGMAEAEGITCYCGAEVTTKEEVHCLAFFEDFDKLDEFQQFLDQHLPNIRNNQELFGYQVVVNENEEIIYEENRLLISAINRNLNQVEEEVHRLGGLFIPAHVDKPKFSLISQLGFVPPDLKFDAIELSGRTDQQVFLTQYPYLRKAVLLRNSDAHQPEDIGKLFNRILMADTGFHELQLALKQAEGRKIIGE